MQLKKIDNASDDAEKIEKLKAKKAATKPSLYSPDEKIFAGIAYIGPLFAFPLLLRQTSNFCQFHARQGMILFGAEIVFWVGSFLPVFGGIFQLAILLLFLGGAAFGIFNVVNEKEESLPLIGASAS